MKRYVHLLVYPLAMGICAQASAGHDSVEQDNSYQAYARVIDVEPIVSRRFTVGPERRCTPSTDGSREDRPRYYRDARGHWQHTYQKNTYANRYEHRHRSAAPSLIGGLLGSLIGHQFGGGNGKTALTIVGAIAGASIGNEIAYGNHRNIVGYSSPQVQRCHTTNRSRVVEKTDGYRVTYRYNGETFTKRMDAHPGKHVAIRVKVTPYEE